jgi:hypothetical protein
MYIVCSFSSVNSYLTWRWPSTVETFRRLTNKFTLRKQLCFDGPTQHHLLFNIKVCHPRCITTIIQSISCVYIPVYSFIQYSVWRQVQSFLQNDSSTYCDLELPPLNDNTLSLSWRSSSSFLRLLPRLLVTSISPFIFPSITCFRRKFLRIIWPIQLGSI